MSLQAVQLKSQRPVDALQDSGPRKNVKGKAEYLLWVF